MTSWLTHIPELSINLPPLSFLASRKGCCTVKSVGIRKKKGLGIFCGVVVSISLSGKVHKNITSPNILRERSRPLLLVGGEGKLLHSEEKKRHLNEH
jgi:hypothetical protein